MIISGDEDNCIKVWDAMNGNEIQTIIEHTAPINSYALSKDE